MRIIAFMEDYRIVKKILDYLRKKEPRRNRPLPKIHTFYDEFDDWYRDDYLDIDYT